MVTISLCMIVKNEEAVLERCLDSLKGLMDEMIIVDTGSDDRTKEIAARYTDQIYEFEWIHDFSAARNFSFSKASMDYIYCADADEVLDETNRKRFLDLKQVLTDEVEIVQMYYCNQLAYNTVYNYDKEYRPKLYKRVRRFQFVDPIHEMVRLDPVVYDSDIEIMHMPVCAHASRDLQGFVRMVKEGQHIGKRLHSMYAKELFIAGTREDFADAMGFFQESAEDETRSLDEVKEAFCVVARAARYAGDWQTFYKYALKCIACDGCAEICCELGDYYLAQKDYNEAALWYSNAAFETECILSVTYQKQYPLQQLTECYEAVGNAQAARQMQELLQQEKGQEET